jgi:hypothetical protein
MSPTQTLVRRTAGTGTPSNTSRRARRADGHTADTCRNSAPSTISAATRGLKYSRSRSPWGQSVSRSFHETRQSSPWPEPLYVITPGQTWCPRQDSNLRSRLPRLVDRPIRGTPSGPTKAFASPSMSGVSFGSRRFVPYGVPRPVTYSRIRSSPSCCSKSAKSLMLKVASGSSRMRQQAAIHVSLAGRGRPRTCA